MLLSGCGNGSPDRSEQPHPEHVETGTGDLRIEHVPSTVEERLQVEGVQKRILEQVVTAPGEVALDLKRVAKVTSRIEGQIEQVYVQLGDQVRAGQALLAIGSLKFDELVEEYLVSKTQAELAEDNLRRIKKLRDDQIISERQLVEARGRQIETKTRYEHIREKLLNMALSKEGLRALEQESHEKGHLYVLKTPLSGTVVDQNVVLGQGVSPGIALLEIVDTSHVWVFASLAIEDARHFKQGDKGHIVPKGGAPVDAPLAYVAPVADEKTRTVQVRFDVSNSGGHLRPHEFVEVRLGRKGRSVLAVRVSAMTQVHGQRGVFLERQPGYEFVPIEEGRESNGWVEVKTGLTAGDRVVTEGVFDLKSLLLKESIQADH